VWQHARCDSKDNEILIHYLDIQMQQAGSETKRPVSPACVTPHGKHSECIFNAQRKNMVQMFQAVRSVFSYNKTN
jgi:hypothetical protein